MILNYTIKKPLGVPVTKLEGRKTRKNTVCNMCVFEGIFRVFKVEDRRFVP